MLIPGVYKLYNPENKHMLYFDKRQLKIHNYRKNNDKNQYHSDTITRRTKTNSSKKTQTQQTHEKKTANLHLHTRDR
jgi:hypothetical protein